MEASGRSPRRSPFAWRSSASRAASHARNHRRGGNGVTEPAAASAVVASSSAATVASSFGTKYLRAESARFRPIFAAGDRWRRPLQRTQQARIHRFRSGANASRASSAPGDGSAIRRHDRPNDASRVSGASSALRVRLSSGRLRSLRRSGKSSKSALLTAELWALREQRGRPDAALFRVERTRLSPATAACREATCAGADDS